MFFFFFKVPLKYYYFIKSNIIKIKSFSYYYLTSHNCKFKINSEIKIKKPIIKKIKKLYEYKNNPQY